mgnify:CR=1 FL=1
MDPVASLVWGFVSVVVGFIAQKTWGFDFKKILSDATTILMIVPLIYLALMALLMPFEEFVSLWSTYLVNFFENLPVAMLGDLGGTMAAWLLGRRD